MRGSKGAKKLAKTDIAFRWIGQGLGQKKILGSHKIVVLIEIYMPGNCFSWSARGINRFSNFGTGCLVLSIDPKWVEGEIRFRNFVSV